MAIATGNTELRNNIISLKDDAIRRVEIRELPYQYGSDYSERASRYMVTLRRETLPRRVYAMPIGNVAVFYVKSQGHTIYCENALNDALYREGN